jgi:hypothetical protein
MHSLSQTDSGEQECVCYTPKPKGMSHELHREGGQWNLLLLLPASYTTSSLVLDFLKPEYC